MTTPEELAEAVCKLSEELEVQKGKAIRVNVRPHLEGLSGDAILFDNGGTLYVDFGCEHDCGFQLMFSDGVLHVDARHRPE